MVDTRRFDLDCFLPVKDMRDLVKNGKNAKCIARLEETLSEQDFDKLMTDFVTKISCEIKPALQIKNSWLATIFGYKGTLRVNIDTHNVDAIYVDDTETLITKIELKHFSTSPIRVGGDGYAEKESYYSPNGSTFYKVSKKSWKFKTADINDDAVLLMMIDNRTDKLIDVICVRHDDICELIEKCKTDKFNGGTHPCAVCYRHVADFPHMIGNRAQPYAAKRLTDWLIDRNEINKSGKRYYSPEGKKISDSRTGVMNWFLKDYRKRDSKKFAEMKTLFLNETNVRKDALRICEDA